MRLENLLRGMTSPGNVPDKRKNTTAKHLTKDEKALFVIQNLVGEIVKLNKVIARAKGSVDINISRDTGEKKHPNTPSKVHVPNLVYFRSH